MARLFPQPLIHHLLAFQQFDSSAIGMGQLLRSRGNQVQQRFQIKLRGGDFNLRGNNSRKILGVINRGGIEESRKKPAP